MTPNDPNPPTNDLPYAIPVYADGTPKQTPKRSKKRLRRFIWPAVAVVAVIGWISTAAAGSGPSSAGAAPAPTVTVTVAPEFPVLSAAPTPTAVAKPTPTPKPAPVKATIPDGYSVDIPADAPAGRYSARSDSTDCYWEINKTSSPSDIVDNGGFIKGHLTVTLKRGETFSSTDCGDWTQQ